MTRWNDFLVNFEKALIDNGDGTFSISFTGSGGDATFDNLTVTGDLLFSSVSANQLHLADDDFISYGNTSASPDFVSGVDSSDSDAWVLSRGSTLGTNNILRLDATTGDITLGTNWLKIDDAAISGFKAADDTDAEDIWIVSAFGGDHTSNHADGGNINILAGGKGSGGSGTGGSVVIDAVDQGAVTISADNGGLTYDGVSNGTSRFIGSSGGRHTFQPNTDSTYMRVQGRVDNENYPVFEVSNGSFSTVLSASSGDQQGLFVNPGAINQTGTAHFDLIKADITLTSTGSGGVNLLRLQADSTDVFSVNSTGQTYQVLSTETLEILDAGSASATEQDWIEVEVGGNVGYIRVYAAK